MAQKRISRARKRDLEQPDEFLTLTSRLLDKVSTHWKPISAGVGVLVVALVGGVVAGFFNEKAEDKAFVMLSQTMQRHAAELASQDAQKALDVITPDFETLFSQYGDRQGGMAGRLMFAQMNYRAGQTAPAIAQYTAAEKGFPEGSYALSAVWSGLGYARAAAGQHEDAIKAFSKIIAGENTILKADAIYQRALLYRKTGQDSEYHRSLQVLKDEYAGFMYAEMLTESTDG